ncbi:MAG: hypothetical protein ACLURV_01280 [Gallintestinimicrobium sp.]
MIKRTTVDRADPEIALTYQTVQRFTARFGDRVSDELDAQRRGKTGSVQAGRARELDVIIGPRSALFVPFPNLG